MGFKVDLHTHSYGSPDGGLKTAHYRYFLENQLLDYIAITDHNSIATALKIQQELGELGKRIIIGEEIMTTEGEIVGLYLTHTVPAGLSPADTVAEIKSQGGLVYVPHPFESVRSGLPGKALKTIVGSIDIMECFNGRAVFQNRSKKACAFSTRHGIAHAASSDAHGRFGWGCAYSVINHKPTRLGLARELEQARFATRSVGMGIIYPKLNRLRKKLGINRA